MVCGDGEALPVTCMSEVTPFLLHPITNYLCYCLMRTRHSTSIANYSTLGASVIPDVKGSIQDWVAHGLRYSLFQPILKRSLTTGAQTSFAEYAEER